ncbi:MAG: hypothetical protein MZV63_68280 [Marinilabiliales bacterium]|nr:hypothetical protein [Marinilabiliales bacterium]
MAGDEVVQLYLTDEEASTPASFASAGGIQADTPRSRGEPHTGVHPQGLNSSQ